MRPHLKKKKKKKKKMLHDMILRIYWCFQSEQEIDGIIEC